jgi:hypothetical protein
VPRDMSTATRISKVLRLFSTPIDGEALSALRALQRVLLDAGTDFRHVANIIEANWTAPVAAIAQGLDQVPRCPTCGADGEFGYRNKGTGGWTWYCAAHRLGEFWADARRSPTPETDWQDFEPSDWEARARSRADRMDSAPAETSSPVNELAPHFDAEGRFIHRCCRCGKAAMLGFGVNLRIDELGTWYCGQPCNPPET